MRLNKQSDKTFIEYGLYLLHVYRHDVFLSVGSLSLNRNLLNVNFVFEQLIDLKQKSVS